jgi:hypothetical protein
VELLGRLRARDPATARDLLASTWASEPYRDRAALLATFATGLSLHDESLAELGLADRRVEVRLVAADLLAKMAGSRYWIEAAERAGAAVRAERTATGFGAGRHRPRRRDRRAGRCRSWGSEGRCGAGCRWDRGALGTERSHGCRG